MRQDVLDGGHEIPLCILVAGHALPEPLLLELLNPAVAAEAVADLRIEMAQHECGVLALDRMEQLGAEGQEGGIPVGLVHGHDLAELAECLMRDDEQRSDHDALQQFHKSPLLKGWMVGAAVGLLAVHSAFLLPPFLSPNIALQPQDAGDQELALFLLPLDVPHNPPLEPVEVADGQAGLICDIPQPEIVLHPGVTEAGETERLCMDVSHGLLLRRILRPKNMCPRSRRSAGLSGAGTSGCPASLGNRGTWLMVIRCVPPAP